MENLIQIILLVRTKQYVPIFSFQAGISELQSESHDWIHCSTGDATEIEITSYSDVTVFTPLRSPRIFDQPVRLFIHSAVIAHDQNSMVQIVRAAVQIFI